MDFASYDAFVQQHFDDTTDPRRLDLMRGPASLASFAAAVECLRENPNLCTASGSGDYLELERRTITQLADLMFGYGHDASGLFTAGGTISNLYGAKIGLEKVIPDAMQKGFQGQRPVGIASEAAHFCWKSIAGWLGLGSDNLHLIPTDRDCSMRLDLMEVKLDELYRRRDRVAFVIGTFGTTDAGGIDELLTMRRIIDAKAKQYGQPVPQLHADAAIGWAYRFLNDSRCDGLKHADSVTLDFHKLGRAHYPSSAFLVKQGGDLELLARSTDEMPYFDEPDAPARWTLETSRPGVGAATAAAANLAAFDADEWQMLIGRGLELAEYLKRRLDELPHCLVLNRNNRGPSVVWWVLPKGMDANTALKRVEAGGDVPVLRRLFDLHQATSAIRLGFTSDIGYRPLGCRLPAWKANFYHPRTTEAMIDELIETMR